MVTQGVVTLLIGTCVENQQTLYSRLLDASSYHPICHKSTATLVKRAKELCSSNGDLESELKLLKEVFTINIYPNPWYITSSHALLDQLRNKQMRRTNKIRSLQPFHNIKGTSERIRRIVRSFNICVAHKPTKTQRNILTKTGNFGFVFISLTATFAFTFCFYWRNICD